MKIAVYAISKNEEKFVKRWYNSMKEADEIYVLDTGSTDNTVKLLKESGVFIKTKEISPWRFDIARNESLKMLPKDIDICVCTDLDEVFIPGWRKELEKVWKQDTNRLKYIYNWSLKNNKPIISFYSEKIHSRKNYKWVNPVHEVLSYSGINEKYEITNNIILNHYPDNSKSRSSYLKLLELAVKEAPNNDRNMHYLGREYMYYSRWNDCIDTLIKHLNMPSATWKDERCASMRFIARSYSNLNRYEEAKLWLEKAINEAPYLKEPYIELALLHHKLNNNFEVINYCIKALTINNKKMTYIKEKFSNDNTIDDLLSVSYYNIGLYDLALHHIKKAIKYNKKDKRLLQNKEIIINKINKKNNKE